ncbi:unnamed protein product [Dracunculus medinensis]|uniref:Deoxyribonuclease TATDN3 n=1 Tax=Dracunculus medinensis TaxID=318479 RepID=A0A0N4U7E5_DRAME|nr:unnamed protein product [Dracunculus medinensis]
MIDCHCHLADNQFKSDIEGVIERAKQSNVLATLVCSEYRQQFSKVFELAEKFPGFCFPCLGVHPIQKIKEDDVSVRLDDFESVAEIIDQNHAKIAAIGEVRYNVGLDFSPRYLKSADAKEQQILVFKSQMDMALKYDLPLNVHSRSAGRPVIELLQKYGARRVLLHAFDGNEKNAQPAIDAGYYFSIPPSFSNSEKKIKLIERIPLGQLCLESDSPVLGPKKGERNEPKNIFISAEFIANIKKIPLEDVIKITTENAKKLFPFLKQLK